MGSKGDDMRAMEYLMIALLRKLVMNKVISFEDMRLIFEDAKAPTLGGRDTELLDGLCQIITERSPKNLKQ